MGGWFEQTMGQALKDEDALNRFKSEVRGTTGAGKMAQERGSSCVKMCLV